MSHDEGGPPNNGTKLGPEFISSLEEKSGAVPEVPIPGLDEEPGEALIEIIVPSTIIGATKPAFHFKIWGDGRIEGFNDLPGRAKRIQVINRTPALIRELVAPMQEISDHLNEYLEAAAHGVAMLAGEAKMGTEEEAEAANEP